jgi:hypothetical protein
MRSRSKVSSWIKACNKKSQGFSIECCLLGGVYHRERSTYSNHVKVSTIVHWSFSYSQWNLESANIETGIHFGPVSGKRRTDRGNGKCQVTVAQVIKRLVCSKLKRVPHSLNSKKETLRIYSNHMIWRSCLHPMIPSNLE